MSNSLIVINVVVLIVIFYYIKSRYIKQIVNLTRYLENVNRGQINNINFSAKEGHIGILEDEIYKTVTMLHTTKNQTLKDKELLKDTLADIAHQIKTPLTAIGMMNEIITEFSDDSVLIYTEQIEKQLTHVNNLIQSLLTLSKLEVNAIVFAEDFISCYHLLLRVHEIMCPFSAKKNQTLSINSPDNPQVGFIGDMSWSIEALINIVKNCIEHTPIGGQIVMQYIDNPIYTSIIIADNGNGFEAEDIPYIFKRFYKGKNSAKESVGIGLSLAKIIFEKQDGIIYASNQKIGGAQFEIKFYKKF
ncbi:hypothetical protein AN639_02585 [Candidatus Epulonipiscium fishelsonii]|uniref:Uncharacterized protein n=1 Tax=Candidatus Epulonipiscium fishelsonii TaxID=77094 RepID=A0ACC8XA87_9FIRM|nr:hypothetical protein AN396_09470 [Epulopiscium sp. SCG-B11WGA-EpuloA1]ONI42013.1 hypothetical protein AN639_02585 [Epulopiscium sp. SCG-B05WGA-EpuloA1]